MYGCCSFTFKGGGGGGWVDFERNQFERILRRGGHDFSLIFYSPKRFFFFLVVRVGKNWEEPHKTMSNCGINISPQRGLIS